MITKTDLDALNDHNSANDRVLSVYLDVDQSNTANLNRKFETAFEARIKEIGRMFEDNEQRDFEECVNEARKVAEGAGIQQLHGDAAEELKKAGGIGAFLR